MSDETQKIVYPSASVLTALMNEKMQTKEKVSEVAGKHGERVKHHVENSNLNTWAFGVSSRLFALFRKNEVKAIDYLAHLKNYIEVVEKQFREAGHVGNLDDMAKKPTAAAAVAGVSEPTPEPKSNVTPMDVLEEKRRGRPKKVKVEAAPVAAAPLDDDLPAGAPTAASDAAADEDLGALPPVPPVDAMDAPSPTFRVQ